MEAIGQRDAEMLVLRHGFDFRPSELADRYSLSPAYVSVVLARARARAREMLDGRFALFPMVQRWLTKLHPYGFNEILAGGVALLLPIVANLAILLAVRPPDPSIETEEARRAQLQTTLVVAHDVSLSSTPDHAEPAPSQASAGESASESTRTIIAQAPGVSLNRQQIDPDPWLRARVVVAGEELDIYQTDPPRPINESGIAPIDDGAHAEADADCLSGPTCDEPSIRAAK